MKKIIKTAIISLLCISFILSSSFVCAVDTTGTVAADDVSEIVEKYDINGDGDLTISDAELSLKIAAGQTENNTKADIDGDGVVTIDDIKNIYVAVTTPVGDAAYVEFLLSSGFTKSYTEDLLALHKKYPNWKFVPFITGLDWAASVEGEHTPHTKQLIENSVSSNLMCACSKCNGVIQEGKVWVSASEEAVAYYLDPRNFLTEEYIFQFETTAYNETHTINAVESILKPTWMYNSEIKYLNAEGKELTYTIGGKPVKYSEAIMKAAKDSGMSAYFLASKIVQEVGSSTSSYAAGSSGKSSPYNGIYNYYNIGAYTGAGDGLRWANGYMKAKSVFEETKDSEGNTVKKEKKLNIYKTATTSAEVAVTVPNSTELNYISKTNDFYKVNVTVSGKSYIGYAHKDYVSVSTSYGRPWDSPYKTIYNGAQYIYSSFSETQFTGYLQKFNVNPASDSLYSHEYMANVRAAAAESQKTYKAYKDNSLLGDAMVFYIPVFDNMPYGDLLKDEVYSQTVPSLSATAGRTSVTLNWDAVDGAEKYQIYRYNPETEKYERIKNVAGTSYTDSSLTSGDSYKYKIRGYFAKDDGYIYTKYSKVITIKTLSGTVEKTGVVDVSDSLNIREEANTSCNVLVQVTAGQKVIILGSSGDFYKVKLTVDGKSHTGYASKDYVKDIKLTYGGEAFSGPTATLRTGSSGDDVLWLQIHLVYLKYLTNDDITGEYDSVTLAAVKKFQTEKKLDVDGLVGKDTRTAIKNAIE